MTVAYIRTSGRSVRPARSWGMAALLLSTALLGVGASPQAQARRAPAPAEQLLQATPARLELEAGGAVQMALPQGFTELTAQEIALKFPRGNAPRAVWGNEQRTVTVAVTDSRAAMQPSQLAEGKAAMEQMLPRMIPNLQWVARELFKGRDRQWVRLEMTSTAIDTDIHNTMYLTSRRGRMWGVNFNATRETYAGYRKAFERSFQSIRFVD